MSNSMRVLLCLVLAPVVLSGTVGGQDGATADDSVPLITTAGRWAPYCGVRSVYAAVRYLGGEIHFESLLKPGYIGNCGGSTLAELQIAVTDHGFYALPIEGIGRSFLEASPYPVVLHVRKDPAASPAAEHYMLYIRKHEGKARVFDPPDPIEDLDFEDLRQRSDGYGLVVSVTPIDEGKLFATERRRRLSLVIGSLTLAFGVMGIMRWYGRHMRPNTGGSRDRLFSAVRQAFAICLVGSIAAFIVQLLSHDGLIALTYDSVGARVHRHELPGVDASYVKRLLRERAGVVIDTRFSTDYEAGHIPGAISIPIDTSDDTRRWLMREIQPGTPLVLYCQTRGCRFADQMGAILRRDGFTDVRVFRGGWAAWIDAQ